MNRLKSKLTLFFLILFATHMLAQEEFKINNSQQLGTLLNPALNGEYKYTRIFTNFRNQWAGFVGAPKTIVLGADVRLTDNMGLGANLIHSSYGRFKTTCGSIAYAYKIEPLTGYLLRFGISGGLYSQKLDTYLSDLVDATDQTLIDARFSEINFVASAGINFQWKGIDMNLALPVLYQSKNNGYFEYIYGNINYKFKAINNALVIKPFVAAHFFNIFPQQIEYGLYTELFEKIWIQAIYRATNYDAVTSIGLNFEKIQIGYAYEINNSFISNVSSGSHEVFIAYLIGK